MITGGGGDGKRRRQVLRKCHEGVHDRHYENFCFNCLIRVLKVKYYVVLVKEKNTGLKVRGVENFKLDMKMDGDK